MAADMTIGGGVRRRWLVVGVGCLGHVGLAVVVSDGTETEEENRGGYG